jgi:hypothetical protein
LSDEFDEVFGAAPQRPGFAARLGRAEPAPPAAEPAAEPGVYKPYGFLPAGGIGESCEVCRWLDGTEIAEGIEFQYRFLMQIGFVGEEQLRLFLPDCIVVIEGKNLRDLRKKLARRQVTFIQQFSPRLWSGSPSQGEPVIDRIMVARPDSSGGS